jgi:pimeloyl-ACP methyl ester carboxylesterase
MPIFEELFYTQHPAGALNRIPVVLIHGAGGSHLSWAAEIRRMPAFQVFALDLPGHGRSGGRGYQNIGDYARVVVNWSMGIGLQNAYYVGHSMGAAITLSIAIQFPELVRGAALLGCGNKLSVAPLLLEETTSSLTYASVVDKIIKWSFYTGAPEKLKSLTAKHMLESRPSVLHSDFVACGRYEVGDKLNSITCPVLVVCGQKDKMVPVSQSRLLAASIQSARLVELQDTGHMMMLEKPQVVCEMLSDFINSNTL